MSKHFKRSYVDPRSPEYDGPDEPEVYSCTYCYNHHQPDGTCPIKERKVDTDEAEDCEDYEFDYDSYMDDEESYYADEAYHEMKEAGYER